MWSDGRSLDLIYLSNPNEFNLNDAASFRVNERTYLLMNDSQPGFDWDKDTLIDITGFSGDINQLSIG